MSITRQKPDRFGFSELKSFLFERRVRETSWYFWDGAALVLLLCVQVVTGAAMALYCANDPARAFESIRHFTSTVPLGWLVRGIHYWSAGALVVVLFAHLFRHLLVGGYKPPREGTWTVGVFLLVLVLTMAFSGYALRWDANAVYSMRIPLNMFYHVPLIGEKLVVLVQGGERMGSLTLLRFFALHLMIIPMMLVFFVGWHLVLVAMHGVTHWRPRLHPSPFAEKDKRFIPHALFGAGGVAFVVLLVVVLMALVAGPPPLEAEATLLGSRMPREEWWFAWVSALFALLPPSLAPWFQFAVPFVVLLALLFLPLLDRSSRRGVRRRPVWAAVVVITIVAIVWLSDLRRRSPWTGHPDQTPPPVPAVVLSPAAEKGRVLFAEYGCTSCHAVSGKGRKVGPDLAGTNRRLSPDELRRFILEPGDIPMPSYRGRMTPGELSRVVEFVLAAQTFPRRL